MSGVCRDHLAEKSKRINRIMYEEEEKKAGQTLFNPFIHTHSVDL